MVKFPKNLQLLLVYKNWLGKLSFQVMSGGKANNKVPFGQVAKCEHTSSPPNEDGEISQYLNFENKEGLKVQYNVNILDVFTAGVSSFTQELAKMRSEGKLELIGLYLTMMTKSATFGLHRPGLYSELGFRTDGAGAGVTEDSLKKAGGSVADYEKFLKLAQASARDPPSRKRKEPEGGINNKEKIQVNQLSSKGKSSNYEELEVNKQPSKEKSQPDAKSGRSKITDFFEMKHEKGKLSKMEVVEKNFEEEIEDPIGVEKTFVEGLFGKAEIDLDKLSVSPKLGIAINTLKVSQLKRSMEARFDPSSCVLMVCPEDEDKFNSEDIDKNYFNVIHGCHRLLALKKIDRDGGWLNSNLK